MLNPSKSSILTDHLANWIAAIATAATLTTLATVSNTNNQVARLEEQNKAIKEQLNKIEVAVERQSATQTSSAQLISQLQIKVESLENRR
jgi:predicted ATP-grasp superfamily ATP-dependent carboligase